MRSYFIDTNYFLRLFVKDDSRQHHIVYSLFQKALEGKIQVYTSVIVFFEIYWVLLKFYNYDKIKTISFLNKVLQMDFLIVENKDILRGALKIFNDSSLELEDCYNILYFETQSLSDFATFDKKLQKIIDMKI